MAEEHMEQDLAAIPAEAAEEAPKTGGLKRLILFIGVPLLLLGSTGAGLYFTGMLDGFFDKGPNCEKILKDIEEGNLKEGEAANIPEECLTGGKAGETGTAPPPGAFFAIPNIIVNFSGASGRPSFLKLGVQIEVANAAEQEKLEAAQPRIVDQFQTYLRELRLEDLKGSSGLYRMRIELKSRVQAAVPGVDVRDVLFQEILIQQ